MMDGDGSEREKGGKAVARCASSPSLGPHNDLCSYCYCYCYCYCCCYCYYWLLLVIIMSEREKRGNVEGVPQAFPRAEDLPSY